MKRIFSGARFLKGFTIAFYMFIFAPILIVILMSFHPRDIVSFPLPGFSVKWWIRFFGNYNLLTSLRISLTLGAAAALVAGLIGTLASFAIVRSEFRRKDLLNALTFAPMVISGVVFGVALLSLFDSIRFPRGFIGLVIAHSLLCIPYVIVVVSARLADFDRSIEEAAMNLGANNFQTFKSITLPVLLPAIIAGMLLAFTISFDEYPATQFLATATTATIPVRIFSMIKTELNPQINVLAAVMVVITICIPMLAQYFLRRK
ncbi:MAG: ABC transporter permease [Desulfobacterales bacterium]|nr:MAG: ABC transporter permease [Desulfobacterales bacterium]